MKTCPSCGSEVAEDALECLCGYSFEEEAEREEELLTPAEGEESAEWPPEKVETPPILTNGVAGAVVFALVLIALFPIGQKGAFGVNNDRS